VTRTSSRSSRPLARSFSAKPIFTSSPTASPRTIRISDPRAIRGTRRAFRAVQRWRRCRRCRWSLCGRDWNRHGRLNSHSCFALRHCRLQTVSSSCLRRGDHSLVANARCAVHWRVPWKTRPFSSTQCPSHAREGSRFPNLSIRAARKLYARIPKEFFFDVLLSGSASLFRIHAKMLRKRGCTIKEVSIPLLNETETAGNNIAWARSHSLSSKVGWFPKNSDDYGEDVSRAPRNRRPRHRNDLSRAMESREKFIAQFHSVLSETKVDASLFPPLPSPLRSS